MMRDVQERMSVELARCEDLKFGESFFEACPVDGCGPRDYLQRIIEVGDGQQLLAGIRFRAPQDFPFVDLIAATHPLDDPAALGHAVEAINREFHAFAPRAVRMMRAADRPLRLPDTVEASVDNHFVAGPVGTLTACELGRPAHAAAIRLQHTDDTPAASQFVAEFFEAFFGDYPHFRDILEPAEAEDLEQCANTGVLAYILIDGHRAGLLATREELGPFITGQCVVEQILRKPFRGHGYAPVAQRRLTEHLAESEPNTILWGTIDHHNTASRATARRNGRHELATWYWLARVR